MKSTSMQQLSILSQHGKLLLEVVMPRDLSGMPAYAAKLKLWPILVELAFESCCQWD